MPRRNSPSEIQSLSDLSSLNDVVRDKRLGQRSSAKKNRRNRHYEKLFIRHALGHLRPGDLGDLGDLGDDDAPATATATDTAIDCETNTASVTQDASA